MLFWFWAFGVFLADRLTKVLVTSQLDLGVTTPVFPGWLHVTYIQNSGGAFGLLPQGPLFFTLVSMTVFAAVIWYYRAERPTARFVVIPLGMVLGGTAGNLYDRLTVGKVIDWIDFRVFPVFNVADSALVIGLGVISLMILWPGSPLNAPEHPGDDRGDDVGG